MDIKKLEKELSSFSSWSVVSRKSCIEKKLEKILLENEEIKNLIEVLLLQNGESEYHSGIHGVIFKTVSRMFFLSGDNISIDKLEFNIDVISIEKKYSGMKITINSNKNNLIFKSISSEYNVKQFFDIASEKIETKVENILDQVNKTQKEITDFTEKMTGREIGERKNIDITDENGENKKEEFEQKPDLPTLLNELNALTGMKEVKDEINTLINLIKIQQERLNRGLTNTQISLHSVFYGPPGTGKTTIARLLGKIFNALGLLKKGHLIETDRAGLVAGYVGQTAIKVDELVNKALDGILFIDEAYSLVSTSEGKDFGQEAIDIILKRMEDYRDRFVVIVAGYTDEMQYFINSNPGLKSRFNRYFYFDHYKPEELFEIFSVFYKKNGFILDDDAKTEVINLFTYFYENRTKTFGNGRFARNLFEKIIEKQANRISSVTPLTNEILSKITKEDIPEKSVFLK